MQTIRLFTVLFLSFFFSAAASAQVFDSGPSDPALFTNVINLPPDDEPEGSVGGVIGETTQLNVADGGVITPFPDFPPDPFFYGFFANEGAEVNISGGTVGFNFGATQGSEVNISGGTVGSNFGASAGSAVNISGGSFGPSFRNVTGSQVKLIGGEYKLNGQAYTDTTITLGADDVFTGTLADGSAFVFAEPSLDALSGVNLIAPSQPLPDASLVPIVTSTPVVSGPHGLRAGQTLTLLSGGELRSNFAVVDATLNVEGGAVESHLEVAGGGIVNISGGSVGADFEAHQGSEVNISGGTVGPSLGARNGSVVNISGGTVGASLVAWEGSELNISGGTVERIFQAREGSVVNISGGSVFLWFANSGSVVNISGGAVGVNFNAQDGSTVNISGGSVGTNFAANSGSTVNLFGSDFALDGIPVDGPIEDVAFTILDRDMTLSGLLADGSPFSFDLNSDVERGVHIDEFEPGATLTVTLTPQVLLGDCNLDGVVDFLDVGPFISLLRANDYLAQADMDEDGVVTFSDIIPFVVLLSL